MTEDMQAEQVFPGSDEEIRISIQEARAVIGLRDNTRKLINTPLFKDIIESEYFEREAVRLVSLMGDEVLPDEKKIEVQKMMYGIAYFQRFLRKIELEGNEMEQLIADSQEELDRTEVS